MMINNSTNIKKKQWPLTSNHWTQKKPRHYGVENSGTKMLTG
jgi:hypothetical protein